MAEAPVLYKDVDQCVDAIIAKVGKDITFGMPLGLGKPLHHGQCNLPARQKIRPSNSI